MEKEKQILEWLQEIPNEKVRKQAIENYHNTPGYWKIKYHSELATSLNTAINAAFEWELTDEGVDYWHSFWETGKYPENTLQQERDEAVELLKVMTSLCRLKYGNLDKDVYEQIEKSEAFLSNLNK